MRCKEKIRWENHSDYIQYRWNCFSHEPERIDYFRVSSSLRFGSIRRLLFVFRSSFFIWCCCHRNGESLVYFCVSLVIFGSTTCFLFSSFRFLLISFADATRSLTLAAHAHRSRFSSTDTWKWCCQDVVETIKESCATIPICCSPASELSTFRSENIKIRTSRCVFVCERASKRQPMIVFYTLLYSRTRIEYRWCLLQYVLLLLLFFQPFFSSFPAIANSMRDVAVCVCMCSFNRPSFVSEWKKNTRSSWPLSAKRNAPVRLHETMGKEKEYKQCDAEQWESRQKENKTL